MQFLNKRQVKLRNKFNNVEAEYRSLKSILRQEKLENLEIDFTDDLIQKRRDSLRKVNELRKESLQRKRDSILKARKNKIK